jgi:hypothetical protein
MIPLSRSAGSSDDEVPSPPLHLPPGTLIDGYRLGRRLGHGREGTVYRAVERSSGITVALKLICDTGPSSRHAARHTARVFHQLRGTGAVAVYHRLGLATTACGTALVYLVFDHLTGPMLADLLECRRWHRHWGEADAVVVLQRLTARLAMVHRLGLAVGDFELGNNIILTGGAALQPVFCDLDPGSPGAPNRDFATDLELVHGIAATLAGVSAPSRRIATIAALAEGLLRTGVTRTSMARLARGITALR